MSGAALQSFSGGNVGEGILCEVLKRNVALNSSSKPIESRPPLGESAGRVEGALEATLLPVQRNGSALLSERRSAARLDAGFP